MERLYRMLKPAFGLKTLYEGDNSTIDIVFVHGPNGHREKSWKATNAPHPWPQTLLPGKIPNARILTFGYDASAKDIRGILSLTKMVNHSENLMSAIAALRAGDGTTDRPIIFVCHCLGGLVCENTLYIADNKPEEHIKQVLDCTRGILYLGTPRHIPGFEHWAIGLARVIGEVPLMDKSHPPDQETLHRIAVESTDLACVQMSFHTMLVARGRDGLPPIKIACFYEQLPLPGIGHVVPLIHASLPGCDPIAIQANHMEMTKFRYSVNPGFVAVAGELSRWCEEICSGTTSYLTRLHGPRLELLELSGWNDTPRNPYYD